MAIVETQYPVYLGAQLILDKFDVLGARYYRVPGKEEFVKLNGIDIQASSHEILRRGRL
jgi:hypothetical protein